MSRADVKEFGELIDQGRAALVIVGETTVQAGLDKAGLRAEKQAAKEPDTSVKNVGAAVREAAGEVG